MVPPDSLVNEMTRLPAPDQGGFPGLARLGRPVIWRLIQVLTVLAVAHACWMLFRDVPYQIDTDVYRMGGQAWLDGRPLYAGDAMFHTQAGLDLPFTYPPLSAVVFGPLALVSLPVAGVAIAATTLLLLVLSTWIVLSRLEVLGGARRWWLAAGLVGLAVWWLEPIQANFSFGQINVILMTLVIADCVPRRTPWPRGLLLGMAIALKLTPAVFLLYFVLRRDIRSVLTASASFVGATLLAFALAPRDSWEYWTATVHNTGRIGNATYQTNQNAAGALARLGLGQGTHFVVWTAACLAVLALTVWAVRRVLAVETHDAPEAALALVCVALFGLVVSPVSWSHHWVWVLPTLVVATVLACRHRDPWLALVAAAGTALMVWPPMALLPEHHESEASWWRQLAGMSYVWWALALLAVAGLRSTSWPISRRPSPESEPTAELVRPV